MHLPVGPAKYAICLLRIALKANKSVDLKFEPKENTKDLKIKQILLAEEAHAFGKRDEAY